MKLKASGGIKTFEQAAEFVNADVKDLDQLYCRYCRRNWVRFFWIRILDASPA